MTPRLSLVIGTGVSRYADAVQATSNLLHFYTFNEPVGSTTIADSKGNDPGTLTGATLGVPESVAPLSDNPAGRAPAVTAKVIAPTAPVSVKPTL